MNMLKKNQENSHIGNSQKIKLWNKSNQESNNSKTTKTLRKTSEEDKRWKPPMLLEQQKQQHESSYTIKSKDTDSIETLSNSNDILQKYQTEDPKIRREIQNIPESPIENKKNNAVGISPWWFQLIQNHSQKNKWSGSKTDMWINMIKYMP